MRLEKQNDLTLNVFSYEETASSAIGKESKRKATFFPINIGKHQSSSGDRVVNLLIVDGGDVGHHYVLMKKTLLDYSMGWMVSADIRTTHTSVFTVFMG